MAGQFNEVKRRLESLETAKVYLSSFLAVLAAMGITLGGFAAYLFQQAGSLKATYASVADQIKELPHQIDKLVSEKVNEDVLIGTFDSGSVLAQVEAQSICTTVAPTRTTTQAVYKRVIDTKTDSTGKVINITRPCTDVCADLGASASAAVHIYSRPPFSVSEMGATSHGLMTHMYQADNESTEFGPNYCCCSK